MSTLRMHRTRADTNNAATTPGPASWSNRVRIAGGVLVLAAVGVVAATALSRTSGTRSVTMPAGTRMVGTLDHTITTENGRVGQTFELRTTDPLTLADGAIVPAGATIRGEVTHTQGGGRIAGAPELTLRFNRLEIEGREYPIVAEAFRLRGKNDALESAAEIGGGAIVGGVVGAVAGSAAKGAIIGGVLGTGVAVATKGDQLVLSAGQKLRMRLAEPVTVQVPKHPAEKA